MIIKKTVSVFLILFIMCMCFSCKNNDRDLNNNVKSEIVNEENNDPYDIISDNLYNTDATGQNKEYENDSVEYDNLLESSKPLQMGEYYTETWQGDISTWKLRPYSNVYDIPDLESQAKYSFVKTANKINGVKITTNGKEGGLYDYVRFAGMRYVKGGIYNITINYTTVSTNTDFYVGWGHYEKKIVDLEGSSISGKYKTSSGKLYLDNYDGNTISGLTVVVNGSNNSSEIIINSITVERIVAPIINCVKIIGEFNQNGNIKLQYIYNSDVPEGNTIITWYSIMKNKNNIYNKKLLKEYENQKEIKVSDKLVGYYLLAEVIPVDINNNKGITNSIVSESTIGERKELKKAILKNEGDIIIDDFENENIISYYSSLINTNLENNSLNNSNALHFSYSDNGVESVIFDGVYFTPGITVLIEFDYNFIIKPNSLFALLRSWSLGLDYDSVSAIQTFDNGHAKVYLTVGNSNDYIFSLYTANQPFDVYIDNFSIKVVDKSEDVSDMSKLNIVGESVFDNCENVTPITAGFHTYQPNNVILTNENSIDGYSIMMDAIKTPTVIHFFNMNNKLPVGKYKISLDIKYITENKPKNLNITFRDDKNNRQLLGYNIDFDDISKDKIINFSYDFNIDTPNYYGMIFYDGVDGSKIVFDNIKIIRVEN